MTYLKTTAALAISLASIVVALRIDAPTPGTNGAEIEHFESVTTVSAPVVRDTEPEKQTETVIHTETAEQRELVEWALGRFEEAGLELPVLTIYAHSDRSDCNGNAGFFSDDGAGAYEVHTCGTDFTLLHELGHAWAAYSLTEESKADFLGEYGYAEWRTDNWFHSGSEHCANVIAWGLMEDRINQTRTRPYDYSSMVDAFEMLTEEEPLWMDV